MVGGDNQGENATAASGPEKPNYYKTNQFMVGPAAENEFIKLRAKFQVADFRLY
jgi:hypothetical protein